MFKSKRKRRENVCKVCNIRKKPTVYAFFIHILSKKCIVLTFCCCCCCYVPSILLFFFSLFTLCDCFTNSRVQGNVLQWALKDIHLHKLIVQGHEEYSIVGHHKQIGIDSKHTRSQQMNSRCSETHSSDKLRIQFVYIRYGYNLRRLGIRATYKNRSGSS